MPAKTASPSPWLTLTRRLMLWSPAATPTMVIHLPKMDKVIGYPETANIIAGGHEGSLNEDGSIDAELQVITGATNELGFNKLSAR